MDSLDTRSCVSVCRALGAEIIEKHDRWIVRGSASRSNAALHGNATQRCDVGNSGTTLFLGLAVASLGSEPMEFDGDEQLRCRSAAPLLDALSGLGVSVKSAPNGCTPITVCGPWKGGRVSLSCPTSQYLSALLLAAPMAQTGVVTEIDVPLLNERPYVEMTLSYLESQDIPFKAAPDFSYFQIPGGSAWKPMSGPVPGDFSSAAFPAAAAAITGGSVSLLGLDPEDCQGDKAFFDFLEKMGCQVQWEKIPGEKIPLGENFPTGLEPTGIQYAELYLEDWQLNVSRSSPLKGGEFDLNDTPDLLPAMAAVACYAQGGTALVNAASARMKECDRITVMAEELGKLGFNCSEREDGLVIHGTGGIPASSAALTSSASTLKTDGRGDHRVVMALASAALGCQSPVEIAGAESAAVSYPGFLELLDAKNVM